MERQRRSAPTEELRWRYGCGSVQRGRRRLRVRDPRAGGAGDERRHEEVEDMFTGDEELQAASNGVAAGNYKRRCVHEERSGEKQERVEGRIGVRCRCSGSTFIEWGGGGRRRRLGHWPSMSIGVGDLDCNQGRALN
jgi:hypothetical protein